MKNQNYLSSQSYIHCSTCHQEHMTGTTYTCMPTSGTCIKCAQARNNLPSWRDGQKCDICGSTAIDHTEMQCQINRNFKTNKLV